MSFDRVKRCVQALPEVAAWPEMTGLIERLAYRESRSVWDYPVLSCEAVGGCADDAVTGSAAVLCALLSIHLVDDMLDEEPDGVYRHLGPGATANLGLAFQAAAHRVLAGAPVSSEARAALQARLAGMGLATAFGQSLDARSLRTEEEYWRVVDAKTPPLFGAALAVGALLGGAPEPVAEGLERLGRIIGRFVQVSDDLSDALKTPAGSDWRRLHNSLPLLFAATVDHPERDEFLRLATRVIEPPALVAAQAILARSGAISYCALKLIELSRAARELLAGLPLPRPAPLAGLLAAQTRPLSRLLERVGADVSALALA